jgi:hypothetical protein
MPDSHQSPDGEKTTTEKITDVRIRDNAPDSQASLPAGTLRGPFLERQGDEQRQPSRNECQKRAEIQTGQRRREK